MATALGLFSENAFLILASRFSAFILPLPIPPPVPITPSNLNTGTIGFFFYKKPNYKFKIFFHNITIFNNFFKK